MPKKTYTYILPEENGAERIHYYAEDFYSSLWDVYNHCRHELKYKEHSEETGIVLECINNLITDKIFEIE